ncbi:unnamed protein product [Ceratitis capitata]|uniref:(Mediterranean fruit fly) hypothetical protein n=1 Tax=Ceratitis capitata TaxID=7213 RepID=A0A811VI97_CERCA|nr:unnamed protein product [Ceratitis capitata]
MTSTNIVAKFGLSEKATTSTEAAAKPSSKNAPTSATAKTKPTRSASSGGEKTNINCRGQALSQTTNADVTRIFIGALNENDPNGKIPRAQWKSLQASLP